jgi:putative hemolysin
MGSVLIILAITAAMIGLTALYVAAEFAAVSARRQRISREAGAGNRLAAMLEPIMAAPERLDTYIAACQVGITVSSLVLGFYGQSAIAGALAPLFSRC